MLIFGWPVSCEGCGAPLTPTWWHCGRKKGVSGGPLTPLPPSMVTLWLRGNHLSSRLCGASEPSDSVATSVVGPHHPWWYTVCKKSKIHQPAHPCRQDGTEMVALWKVHSPSLVIMQTWQTICCNYSIFLTMNIQREKPYTLTASKSVDSKR